MNLAALSGFVRRRWPGLAAALGFYTLTGRYTCIGVVPAGRSTRITLLLRNPAVVDAFLVGRSYFVDVTPDL